MKNLIDILAVFVFSTNLYSADTSGCQMLNTVLNRRTQTGNLLQAKIYKSSSPLCWNAPNGQVILSYQWYQENLEIHKVTFWTRVNNIEVVVPSYSSCTRIDNYNYGHDTSGNSNYLCKAEAQISKGFLSNLLIEVAPLFDGQWDTAGYSQNYYFQL